MSVSRGPRFRVVGPLGCLLWGAALGALVARGFSRRHALRPGRRSDRGPRGGRRAAAGTPALRGLLLVCAWCRRIRDGAGAWLGLETYISEHSEADFTHGICPGCRARVESGD